MFDFLLVFYSNCSITLHRFYPPDDMLARYWLWPCVCPSICLLQTDIVSKLLDESSWGLARRLPVPPTVYRVAKNSGIS